MNASRSRRRYLAVTGLLLLLLLGLHGTPSASAQGPTCPPGFVWQRMSGVGCVQEGCLDISNAKYTYTNACSCVEGYKGCFAPVDYEGFDRKKCEPFCPVSALVACVAVDADCPGKAPIVPPTSAPAVPTAAPNTNDDTASLPSVDDLVRDLEQFLAGAGTRGPTAGKTAAGGAALSALIGAWVLINLLSGRSLADLLRAVGIVQRRAATMGGVGAASGSGPSAGGGGPPAGPTIDRIYDGTGAKQHINRIDPSILSGLRALNPDAPDYRDKVQQVLDKVKTQWVNGRRIKGIAYDWKTDASGKQILDEDSIVIVVEEPEYPTPPSPAAPPPATKAAPPPPPPPKPKTLPQIYQSDPSKFRRCQDMVYARIYKRAPPNGTGQNKGKLYQEMARRGYWEVHQGWVYDPKGAEQKLTSLKDGDIIMFDPQGLPDEHRAPHYAVVEGGKIHQILNMPQRGEYLAIDLKDAGWFLRQRQYISQTDGKTWNLKPYHGFKVFRPPP
jgi:hypothetical protein